MGLVAKKTQYKKRMGSTNQLGAHIDPEEILLRNRILEAAGLERFLIRFPRLLLRAHFYYKFIENGEFAINNHGHWDWEISRACSGIAEYSITDSDYSFQSTGSHYLVIPPKTTHRWHMQSSPLMLNSWQVKIEAEDKEGERVLETLRESVIASGFLIKASSNQLQAESLLWQMTNETISPQMFGPILSGFARILLGDLFMQINPWTSDLLESNCTLQSSLNTLAERMKVFLDENVSHPITLSDMEAHFHYSGRHLNRIFQKVHHCSIGHYLRNQRIELSKRWLLTTTRSIKDIALSLGYNNSSQFCRYFMDHANQTPSEYREKTASINNENIKQSVAVEHCNIKGTKSCR